MSGNDGAVPGDGVRRRRLVALLDIAGADLGVAVSAQDGTSHQDLAGGSASSRSVSPGCEVVSNGCA